MTTDQPPGSRIRWIGAGRELRSAVTAELGETTRSLLVINASENRDEHGGDRTIVVFTESPSIDEAVAWFAIGARAYVDTSASDAIRTLASAIRSANDGHCWIDPSVAEHFIGWIRVAAEVPDELGLTRREREILALLHAGKTNGSIAEELCLAQSTVKSYTKSLYHKLGVHTRTDAIQFAESCS